MTLMSMLAGVTMIVPLAASARSTIFELNGTRFYIPASWTITAVGSEPSYDPRAALDETTTIKVERSILLTFPGASGHPDWRTRYPEISPPFVDDVALAPGPRDLTRLQQGPRVTSDPVFMKALAENAPDADGFSRLGEKSYVAVRPDDNDGAGGYLQFSCRADLTEKDRGVASRCTVYTYALDGIGLRTSFDGVDFGKPQWREIVGRVHGLIRWLATPPAQRPEKFS